MEQRLGGSLGQGLLAFIPFFIILLILSIAGPIGLGGWLLSVKSLAPKASRIDPIAGLKRMFSLKALVELGKAIGKVLIILTVAVALLRVMQGDIIGLADASGYQGIVEAVKIVLLAAVILSASTIVIAVIDVPWQIWDTTRQLKMSHQEIKDEMKDSEGKPEVKNKIRQLQRDMATSRMMAAVPDADVVITNPTHYSVAVKYNPADMSTPIVVAKGVDHIALKIREIANAHSIDLVEAPALARAVYHTTDIDGEIPSGLYLAVAQVLAYIFQLRQFRLGKGRRPQRPRSYPVPEEFYFDQ
jgi:flagellar biosynthetic protein FlhB